MPINARIVYFGTPQFSVPPLEAILEAGFEVPLVVTAPDRPAGRGEEIQKSAIKEFSAAHSLPVITPERPSDDSALTLLRDAGAELFVVAAYGLILPQRVLDIPARGGLNIHPSLLPRWRGASPIEHALLAGDARTGVTIMQMDAEMDHGPIIVQKECEIGDKETQESLTEKLSNLSAELIAAAIPEYLAGTLTPRPQEHAAATFTKLLSRDDGRIDWSVPADELERRVRAFHRWPGAFTFWQKNGASVRLKIGTVAIADAERHSPGEAFRTAGGKFAVAARKGALVVERLQPEGKKSMSGEDFLRGNPEILGSVLL